MKGHWQPGFILQKKTQVPNPTRQEAWYLIHNSRSKPSSVPQHKTRPASLVQTSQKPRDGCQKWRTTLKFPPQLEMRPYSFMQWCETNPEVPLATRMQIWLPWGNISGSRKSPHTSRGTLSFPPQFHKNHEILPFTRDEAFLCCSVSQEISRSLLELERELDTLS